MQLPTDTFRGFPTRRTAVRVAGRDYQLLMPQSPDRLLDDPRTLQRFERSEYLPYWATLWPGARLLAEHVAAQRVTRGRRTVEPPQVLELGCGLGLTGIVAGSLGLNVTLTDYDEDALAFAEHNASLNQVQTASFRILDWSLPASELAQTMAGRRFDLVLAADALYEARNHAPVARCIAALLAPQGAAWLSDPGRSIADPFPRVAAELGLACEIHPAPGRGDTAVMNGRVFELTWRESSGVRSTVS